MGGKEETLRKIIIDLQDNNICNYCILRFLNEKNPEFYKRADEHVKKLLGTDCVNYSPETKRPKSSPCSACLGLLQMSGDSDYVKAIVTSVTESEYDCDSVTFALSLPITYLLRNRSVWLYLTSKYFQFFKDKYYAHEIKQEYLVVSVKEVWKWISAQSLAEKLHKTANNGVEGSFHVNIHVQYEEDEEETSCLFKMYPKEFQYRSNHKRKFHGELLTRKTVEKMLLETDEKLFEGNYAVPPVVPKNFVTFSNVECVHDSIFLAGRYNKLSRNLSQTPWMINGERRMETSVEEIIEKPISDVIKNSGIKFSSSGREDVDVRTLGKGRPFVVELVNPRKTKLTRTEMLSVEKMINSSTEDVFVRDLQVVDKEDLHHIKAGEETKTKTYTCYCLIKLNGDEDTDGMMEKLNGLNDVKDMVIQQRTPVRVLHRRPLAVRPRTVYWLKPEFHEVKNGQLFFKLSLKVGAGTYIKEFVHGDFGRTSPNLSEILGRETDILALDVEEVALQWPPHLEYSDIEE